MNLVLGGACVTTRQVLVLASLGSVPVTGRGARACWMIVATLFQYFAARMDLETVEPAFVDVDIRTELSVIGIEHSGACALGAIQLGMCQSVHPDALAHFKAPRPWQLQNRAAALEPALELLALVASLARTYT